MKRAVIATGGKQYLVSEGETLEVELLKTADKKVEFSPLLIINDDKIEVGTPEVTGKVTADILEQEVKADKVTAIRYKPKKRVKKVHAHRQRQTQLKITKISAAA
jgi:large subunit ribosomal protein L21